MNVRRFRFTLQSSFEHLLRGHILAAVQFDYTAIVKRVSVAREHAFGSQTRFRNCQVRAGAGGDLRNLRILLNEDPKLVTRLGETSSDKLFVSAFKRTQRGRFVDSRLPGRRRWSLC